MLSSIFNRPRRRTSGSASLTPPPTTTGIPDREEDGFLLLGQSESERSTIMPTSSVPVNSGMVPPPPSYEQVTRSPSLPPASVDTGNYSNPSVPSTPVQYDHTQGIGDNRTMSTTPVAMDTAPVAMDTSPGLNKSGNSNWGIVDVPFQMSPMLGLPGSTEDTPVPELQEVDWRQYSYDFQFEMNVKHESEVALEDEDYVWQNVS